uniref:Knottin scorpion toxin-like domain-containing protein n=1 Tax=Oryza punctata TaxID=4537 RepID=A0A0E0MD92_ORYPU
MAMQLSARSKSALFVVVAVIAAPLLMHDLLAAAALAAADGGGSSQQQQRQPDATMYAGCFRAGGCQLTPEWCPARCIYLGFSPGAGCEVMDDGHIYCCCGPSRTSTHTTETSISKCITPPSY